MKTYNGTRTLTAAIKLTVNEFSMYKLVLQKVILNSPCLLISFRSVETLTSPIIQFCFQITYLRKRNRISIIFFHRKLYLHVSCKDWLKKTFFLLPSAYPIYISFQILYGYVSAIIWSWWYYSTEDNFHFVQFFLCSSFFLRIWCSKTQRQILL